tara:strand:+ start:72301 stop:73608 length:1308 start_codon:yes stop_codon:yes gene_type:complete
MFSKVVRREGEGMSVEKELIVSFDEFVDSLDLEPKVDFETYSESLSVLYTNYSRMSMDDVTKPVVRHTFSNFIAKYGRADFRTYVAPQFIESAYEMFVLNREETLRDWYDRYISVDDVSSHLNFRTVPCHAGDMFDGVINSDSGKILRNLNYGNLYSTKRLHKNDFQDCISILKCLFKWHYLRSSFIGPASFNFFLDKDLTSVWSSVMSTISRPTMFNPNTYAGILNTIFSGKSLFAPTMGWNSYQLAFYQTNFERFVSTDVISDVVETGNKMHSIYESNKNPFLDYGNKEVILHNCPSEFLEERHDFMGEYENSFDAVLFGPPCFRLEMYAGSEQSTLMYDTYSSWLRRYWIPTLELCYSVMKPGAKLGFTVKDYADYYGMTYSLEHDMGKLATDLFGDASRYKIKLSQMKTKRSPRKLALGNYEVLLVYEKKG